MSWFHVSFHYYCERVAATRVILIPKALHMSWSKLNVFLSNRIFQVGEGHNDVQRTAASEGQTGSACLNVAPNQKCIGLCILLILTTYVLRTTICNMIVSLVMNSNRNTNQINFNIKCIASYWTNIFIIRSYINNQYDQNCSNNENGDSKRSNFNCQINSL